MSNLTVFALTKCLSWIVMAKNAAYILEGLRALHNWGCGCWPCGGRVGVEVFR